MLYPFLLLGVLASMARAEDPAPLPDAPAAAVESAEEGEDIRIRYGEEQTVYEYIVNGEVVEIKVVPKVGPVYYLVPNESGEWDRSTAPRYRVPSWKLLEW